MATLQQRKPPHAADVDIVSVLESTDGDEALKLVGRERTAQFSEGYNKQLRRKLDHVIPPLCAAVYFTQFLDKTSLNYASIMGFPITGQHYNLVSLAFYAGFLAWVFPTVYIAQKTRVAKYLGANIIVWGVVLMCHAATTSFNAFFALRFILGMCESCVTPILILIIAMFYKKDEQGTRVSWFYMMNGNRDFVQSSLSQIFGGFFAYGVSFYEGHVLLPYQIIFLLLGVLAIMVGVCVIVWLPDSPVNAHMLTTEERIAALERVRDGQAGTENRHLKKEQVIEALADLRTWLIALIVILSSIPNGAFSNFSNIIIKGFGYTSRQTLILSTPGGAIASIATLLCGWYSDKKNERIMPIIICLVPTMVGSAMLIGLNDSGHKGALLVAIYLVNIFNTVLPTVYAYNASNISGNTKKNTVNALTLTFFGAGNMIGAEIFQPKDAPAYIPAKTANMVLITLQLFITLWVRWINLRLNAQKRATLEEERIKHGWTDADVQRERERHAFMDLTDKQNPFFVYAP
ncbi:MFS general substrate transporter [Trametes versicolor FP-101664 SS1]|uniref:MFS general substrate transporter n=1 Tax=Trametes versicolor (strain FP-101664) TaxID=717944 RepID=UPI0004623D09|nr:MFS general substrate transporter [Trametes versicolor FP-101664 SS1]EIW61736.1 MFS general substrate transporter [Trametes versicolor FP-101664 SS1]